MQLHINPHEPTPVYRQIEKQIAAAIAGRELQPGDRLLPDSELAVRLAVSPAAVRKAYEELQAAGLCGVDEGGSLQITDPGLGRLHTEGTDLALSLIEKALLVSELESARDLQIRLLPPAELTGDGWATSCRCYASGALAGDFYDVLVGETGRLDLVVADVAGKGLAAGLIMASAKSLLPLAAQLGSPAEALGQLNDRLLAQLGRRQFVAMTWARFDLSSGELRIASAGLPEPYLLHRNGSLANLPLQGDRLPLGIRPGVRYVSSACRLEIGDRLLLVTDGLPEARDRSGLPIGYDGLFELLRETGQPCSSLAQPENAVWLDRFFDLVSQRTGSILEDDWTALLLERRPT